MNDPKLRRAYPKEEESEAFLLQPAMKSIIASKVVRIRYLRALDSTTAMVEVFVVWYVIGPSEMRLARRYLLSVIQESTTLYMG